MANPQRIDLQFSTLQSTNLEYTTGKLNGILHGIYLNSDKPVTIRIFHKNWPDVVVFEALNYQGERYLPIATEVFNSKHKVFNYNSKEFLFIEDEITIQIQGPIDSKILLSLRLY